MFNKKITAISTAAIAAGLGLGAVQLANAETPTPTPDTTASPSATASAATEDDQAFGRGRHGAMGHGQDLAELAEKLGVAQADLEAAFEAARDEVGIPEMGAGRPADRSGMVDSEHRTAIVEAVASELGLTADEVTEAMDELRAEHQAQRAESDQEVLDSAVSAGTLTQAEADAVAKAIEEGIVHVRGGGPNR
ncbi:hypothetical protein LKO27_03140 [Tessaracoccus sp. OS52]|uniref:hypothetical protein n=1 Tax=Tessaracoccus sp. OS52 TaxID=2886691 RepID=UPI001D128401|nr:hypothetical protein [Tessaracoccus sp. OS52]MCC2592417.1 hypothetical protein [Tessaracoccus sp. OS52]